VDASLFSWLELERFVAADPVYGARIREGSRFHVTLAGLAAYRRAVATSASRPPTELQRTTVEQFLESLQKVDRKSVGRTAPLDLGPAPAIR
jgi:hypothetical protein